MSDLTSHLVHYGSLSHWSDVETLVFGTRYPVEGSNETMGIWRAGIDTGGGQTDFDDWSRTEEAYQWLRNIPKGVVFGIKGASRQQLQRVRKTIIDKWPGKNRPMPGGLELRLIDTAQFKGIIHWRITRKEGETQRFTLNADTGIDYASQILSEELRKGRKGTIEWKRIRKDNHLLDAEVYAAACADGEWTPSLAFLAKNEKKDTVPVKKNRNETAQTEGRTRPGWYANR
jgi:phage terminase large subunit GpA-like protein